MKSEANARAKTNESSFYRSFVRWVAEVDDGAIVRVVFFALLLGTASVLFVDYRELTENEGSALSVPLHPILPPASVDGPDQGPMPRITTNPETLEKPLEIALGTGGELHLTGTIDPGAADRFASEIAARGEYVQTVVLDSPGGSVVDALAIGSLIHESGLATKVAAGSLCASSCPLIFASGKARIASAASAIGVHQIYASALAGDAQNALRLASTAMSDAQSATADILAHLTETGVDPAMWVHALQTPPDRLYYFKPEEMLRLKLVTELVDN